METGFALHVHAFAWIKGPGFLSTAMPFTAPADVQ